VTSTTTSPTPRVADQGEAELARCDPQRGWWSRSAAQVEADLAALLPEGTRLGKADTPVFAQWSGKITTGEGVDDIGVTLLPPPGVLGTWRTVEEASRLDPCGGGANQPSTPVRPCDELDGEVVGNANEGTPVAACDEIRSEGGVLVGVVTEKVMTTVVDGQTLPTDETYIAATVAAPGGGHVELDLGNPDTLTADQIGDLITSPVWTS
jgi:hypothetical protein